MHEVQMWVIILFVIMAFDRIAILFGRVAEYWDARGNGQSAPVTLLKLRETLGVPISGKFSFLDVAQESGRERAHTMILSLNAIKGVNDEILETLRELVALEKARAEFRR